MVTMPNLLHEEVLDHAKYDKLKLLTKLLIG